MTALFGDWRHGVLLVLLFCLPVLLADVGTALIMVTAGLVAITAAPRLIAKDFPETHAVRLLLTAFVLMAVALSISAHGLWDARFILNFAPLLIALPLVAAKANYRPQASLTHIAVLSAAGALLSLVVAGVQVFVLEESRAGGHVINAIHFANIAVTLGIISYFAMLAAPVVGVMAGPKDRVFLGRVYGALVLAVGFFVFGLTSRLMGQALQLTLFCMMTMIIARYGWKENETGHAI
tara:strand:- start:46 stop:756 length:711 start_codon:yes stop_codon:yes gene_type:complete